MTFIGDYDLLIIKLQWRKSDWKNENFQIFTTFNLCNFDFTGMPLRSRILVGKLFREQKLPKVDLDNDQTLKYGTKQIRTLEFVQRWIEGSESFRWRWFKDRLPLEVVDRSRHGKVVAARAAGRVEPFDDITKLHADDDPNVDSRDQYAINFFCITDRSKNFGGKPFVNNFGTS